MILLWILLSALPIIAADNMPLAEAADILSSSYDNSEDETKKILLNQYIDALCTELDKGVVINKNSIPQPAAVTSALVEKVREQREALAREKESGTFYRPSSINPSQNNTIDEQYKKFKELMDFASDPRLATAQRVPDIELAIQLYQSLVQAKKVLTNIKQLITAAQAKPAPVTATPESSTATRATTANQPTSSTSAQSPEPQQASILQSATLTITFADGTPPYTYFVPYIWNSNWRHNVSVSQNDVAVLAGLITLLKGQTREVAAFWETTWKGYNFLQRNLLLEIIYAIGAQNDLLRKNKADIRYILILDWKDNSSKLYIAASAQEIAQFATIQGMIDDMDKNMQSIDIIMQYDTDFEKDHALKSLELLFNFAANTDPKIEFSNLNETEKAVVTTLFAAASSKHMLQIVLWANKFGIDQSKLMMLIRIYVDKMCSETVAAKSAENISILSQPEELKKAVFDTLLKKIDEAKQDIDTYANAVNNTATYSTLGIAQQNIQKSLAYQATQEKNNFNASYTAQITTLQQQYDIKNALTFYLIVFTKLA